MIEKKAIADSMMRVSAELRCAQRKFPAFHSAHEGYAVIAEELNKLWDLVRARERTPGALRMMRGDCEQIAAMALRFVEDVCEKGGE